MAAGYPGRFRQVEEINEVLDLLRKKNDTKKRVDVADEATVELAEGDKAKTVDTTPVREYYPFRALAVLLSCAGLYRLLYRSPF